MANRISVIVDVAVDKANAALGNFRKSVADADTATGKFKAGAGAAMDSVKANAGNLALAGGTALVAFGAKAIGAFNDLAIEAGRMSEALGVPVEDMSRLIEVAGDLGIEADTLEKVLGKMNQTAGQSPAAFEAIGAEIVKTESGATDVNATFLATVDALKRIQDPARRAAAAQQIFGRSWRDSAELIGLSSKQIADAMADVSEAQVIDEDEVKKARDYREAMDNLNDVLTQLTLTFGEQLTPIIADAANAIVGLQAGIEKADESTGGWISTANDWAVEGIKIASGYKALEMAADEFGDTTDEATESTAKNSQALVQASIDAAFLDKASADLAASQEAAAKSAAEQERAQEQTNRSIRAAQQAVNDLMSAQLSAIDSNLGYRNAQADAAAAVLAYDEAANDAETSTVDLGAAARDAEGAVLAQAAAAVQLAEDQASANGESLSAIEKNQLFKAELETLAGYTSGPLKAALEDYIATLGRIPSSVSTNIQMIPGGDLKYRAGGGVVGAGETTVVGEHGPEVVKLPAGSRVYPTGTGPGGGATVGGGATTVNVTVNGGDPNTIIAAIRKYVRTNGPITGIT